MKKKYKIILLILVVLIIIVSIALFIKSFLEFEEEENGVKVVDSISGYNYTLDERDTKLMKDTYQELKSVLQAKSIDYEEYASLLAKLFVIDLFTITNKVNKYDVGGYEYIYSDNVSNYKLNVEDTLYKHLENNNKGKRTQTLPEVREISVLEVTESTFLIKDTSLPSYEVSLTWDYLTDLGYDNKAIITLVNEQDILYIVEYKVGE